MEPVIKNSHFNLFKLLCLAKLHELIPNIGDFGITCDLYCRYYPRQTKVICVHEV